MYVRVGSSISSWCEYCSLISKSVAWIVEQENFPFAEDILRLLSESLQLEYMVCNTDHKTTFVMCLTCSVTSRHTKKNSRDYLLFLFTFYVSADTFSSQNQLVVGIILYIYVQRWCINRPYSVRLNRSLVKTCVYYLCNFFQRAQNQVKSNLYGIGITKIYYYYSYC